MQKSLCFVLLVSMLFQSWVGCKPKEEVFSPNAGEANFSKLLVLGGSYLSGYTHGGLSPRSDSFSIPALMHRSMKLAGAGPLRFATVGVEGGIGIHTKPWEALFQTQSVLSYKTDCKGISALSPIKSIPLPGDIVTLELKLSNINVLALPFVSLSDYTNPNIGGPQGSVFYRRLASAPGTSTILQDALAQQANFFMAWPGMDDLFNWAAQGGVVGNLPNPATFERQLDTVLSQLCAQGAKGVLANIPHLNTMPFYTTVAWNNADLNQGQVDTLNEIYAPTMPHIVFKVGRNGFVILDANAPNGYRQLEAGEYITLSVPLDSMKCYKYGLMVNVVHDRYVIDKNELATWNTCRNSINQIIAQKAQQYGLALFDADAYMKQLIQGIPDAGMLMNSQFVSGNFFSLDGYHPTEKGYALLANEMLRVINNRYQSNLPLVHCADCRGILFP